MISFSNSPKNEVFYCHGPEIPLTLTHSQFVQEIYAGDFTDVYNNVSSFRAFLMSSLFSKCSQFGTNHILCCFTTQHVITAASPYGFARMSSEHPLLKKRIPPCKKSPYCSSECDSVIDRTCTLHIWVNLPCPADGPQTNFQKRSTPHNYMRCVV